MAGQYDVAGLGNAIVDVIAAADDEFLLQHNIAKGVMTLIDDFRADQLLRVFPEGQETAGGSAANTMAGLASLGGTGLFVGKTKADRLGASFADSLKSIGVHYATKPAKDGAASACCLIVVTPDGHRSMNTYLGAAREIAPHDIDETEIAAAQILYVEGYLWDAPEAKAAINKAMAAAKRAGRKVAFTLSDPFCVARWRDEFRQLMGEIDILFANEEEAKALFEVDEFDGVLQALRHWPGIAALTRSEKGCVVAQRGDVHVLDAVPVSRVVDTTGAGDQFAAGFLYGVTHGKHLADAGRLGALAAAEVISHYGARPEVSLARLAKEAGLI
ncbi:MAG TPA: adenosine kinase [Rhizomicrobium sp.]|jgi:sugar/nucleoside kinase (ribokinase family)